MTVISTKFLELSWKKLKIRTVDFDKSRTDIIIHCNYQEYMSKTFKLIEETIKKNSLTNLMHLKLYQKVKKKAKENYMPCKLMKRKL